MSSSIQQENPVHGDDIKMTHIVSFPLALSRSGQSLHCSLHKCANPFALSKRLQTGSDTTPTTIDSTQQLALLNARRIVGLSQLCCAANLACHRPNTPTWDTVFLAAASTHLGHVLRDYAFVRTNDDDGNNDNDDDGIATQGNESMVIVFMISSHGVELYQSLLEQHGLSDSMLDLEDYLQRQRETLAQEFQSWYKLTALELASSSLEACVLTKITTKMA